MNTQARAAERSEPNRSNYGVDPLLVQLLYKVYFKAIQRVLLCHVQTRDQDLLSTVYSCVYKGRKRT